MSDDPELEAFLRQFRPRPPRPLALRRRRVVGWRLPAAAAAAAASALLALWSWSPGGPSAGARSAMGGGAAAPLTAGVVARALRSGSVERLLDAAARRGLPDPHWESGAFRVIGDVDRDRGEARTQ